VDEGVPQYIPRQTETSGVKEFLKINKYYGIKYKLVGRR